MNEGEIVIKFKNVTKRYGNNTAVDNVSFNIKEGEFFCVNWTIRVWKNDNT